MPGTFSQVLLHIVFSTKHRERWLKPDLCPRLYSYLGGIIKTEFGALLDAGGIEDHVHLYVRIRTEHGIAKMLRTIKSQSSQWIHANFAELRDFAWQEGYSVFSVSKSQETAVKRYIQTQAERHRTEDFKSELLRLLRKHEVEFDEKYVFD